MDRGIIEIQGSSAPTLPDDVQVVYGSGAPKPAGNEKPAKEAQPLRVAADLNELILSRGSIWGFAGHPLTLSLLLAAVIIVGSALLPAISRRRQVLVEEG